MGKIQTPLPWSLVFDSVIYTAFKKLLNDNRAWNINILHSDISKKIKLLQYDYGVNLLMETTVTSYIYTEFINSPLTSGMFLGDEKEPKFYQISREVNFKTKEEVKTEDAKGKNVDFVLNRIIYNGEDRIKYSKYPVLIEAKRYRNYTIEEGGKLKVSAYNKYDLMKDITSLIYIKENFKDHEKKWLYKDAQDVFIWYLTWGIVDEIEDVPNIKDEFEAFAKTDKNLKKIQLTKIKPQVNPQIIPIVVDKAGQVSKWLWYILSEIDECEGKKDKKFVEISFKNTDPFLSDKTEES